MSKHITTALNRISRSPYQTFAAISIMSMTLFLASVFSIMAVGSQVVLKFFETRPQVNAYYKDDYVPTPQEVELVKSKLLSSEVVEDVKFVSKDEALKIYKQYNQSDPLLLEAVTADMLPASLEVSAKDPNDLKQIAQDLRQIENISDVRFAEDIVSTLTTWTKSVRIIGISLVGANILITFVIILLIIGIKVASRREEILILQLVGANHSYISAPFVWEGVIYGVVGAICAWVASYILLLYSTPFLVTFLAGVPILPVPVTFMLALLGAEICLGVIVGGLGGGFAARRYLKA